MQGGFTGAGIKTIVPRAAFAKLARPSATAPRLLKQRRELPKA